MIKKFEEEYMIKEFERDLATIEEEEARLIKTISRLLTTDYKDNGELNFYLNRYQQFNQTKNKVKSMIKNLEEEKNKKMSSHKEDIANV